MAIVDSHVHVWRRHPLDEMLAEMETAGVDKAIIIGAVNADNPDNNEHIAECVRDHPGTIAALADIDIKAEDAQAKIEWALEDLGLQGFSHYLSPEDPLDWFMDDARSAMWSKAEQLGLTVSLSLYPNQHEVLRRLAAAHPALRIMLCHIARPDHLEAPPFPKFHEVIRSAGCPNIYIKISGFYAYTDRPWNFPYHEAQKWVRMVLDAYGPERMCWGSDFSPVLNHSTYRQSLEIVRSYCPFLSESDLEWVLGKAAMEAVTW